MHVEPASPPPVTQTPPLWQMLPAQQAMFRAPHIMQMLGPVGGFAQASPEPHMLFAQHCWLLPPHGSHDCVVPPSAAVWQHIAGVVVPGGFTHAAPVLHVPLPPPPGQHGWPGAPHAAQLVPPSAPATQAPPLWQMSPGQQAMPTAPHIMQTLGPVPAGFAQPRPVLQTLPLQQFWPLPPQGSQVMPPSPVWQEWPAVHWFAPPPPQQRWPVPPHASHIIIAQTVPGAVQVVPPPPPPQHV